MGRTCGLLFSTKKFQGNISRVALSYMIARDVGRLLGGGHKRGRKQKNMGPGYRLHHQNDDTTKAEDGASTRSRLIEVTKKPATRRAPQLDGHRRWRMVGIGGVRRDQYRGRR
jgi:hypothetical protein